MVAAKVKNSGNDLFTRLCHGTAEVVVLKSGNCETQSRASLAADAEIVTRFE
jgi:hypothetical protein